MCIRDRVNDARAELESRGERESMYLANASELALLVGDSETLKRLAESNLRSTGAAKAVLFLDPEGAVLAAAGSAWEVGLARQCWMHAADCSGGEQRYLFDRAVQANAVSYTHLRAHETVLDIVCRLLLEKKNTALLPHVVSHTITH